ncbi:RICIN domain-containing protein [Sorangium sp. So ce394]|uniref:RICIN domain-containing protein n=1 Tax=Sorangium sp. So ce394 TaxID=3133310 RepID=UPI003F5CAC23
MKISIIMLAACSVLAGCLGNATDADVQETGSDQAALVDTAGQLKSAAGACLGVDPTDSSGAVKVVSCTPSATSAPDWIFHRDGAAVIIENAVTHKCIDALDSGVASGTPLVQEDCRLDGGFFDSQRFHTQNRGGGNYRLAPMHARDPFPGMCMTIPGGITTAGVEAELQACGNVSAAQYFKVPQ